MGGYLSPCPRNDKSDRPPESPGKQAYGKAPNGKTRSLSGMNLFENEDRMSAKFSHYRTLGVVVIFSLGAILAGCSPFDGDPGAKRSQQQAEELRNRIKTTQIDR